MNRLASWRAVQPDESVTSWIVRLARANAMGLHELGTLALSMSKHSVMHCDFDIRQPLQLSRGLADLGNVSLVNLWAQSLASYRHRLSALDTLSKNRFRIRWLLLRSKGTKQVAQAPWTQLCPLCLKQDVEPYFRYWWRLAFVTECPIHKIPLIDRCPSCRNIIDFTISERGPPPPDDWYPLSRCPHCQTRWDTLESERSNEQLLCRQQEQMLRGLTENWTHLSNGETVMAPLFLDGCCQLIREMRRPPAGWKLFDRLVKDSPVQQYRNESKSMPFESLEINERREWLKALCALLEQWPDRLIDEARQVRFTLSYLRGQRGSSPFWIDKQGLEYLDRRWHKASKEERVEVSQVLQRHGRKPSANAINTWLGKGTPDRPNGLKKSWPGIHQCNLPGFHTNDVDRLKSELITRLVMLLRRYCALSRSKSVSIPLTQLGLPLE